MSLNKDGTYTGYIYKIENLINGKCYIGQTTTTIAHRWGQHSSNHKNMGNMIICKAIRKYGKESFKITQLEEITNNFKGVDKSFAIQAGREVRVMVVPEVVSDSDMVIMARDISKQIEDQMEYPGQIKVSIVRESRAVDYAK